MLELPAPSRARTFPKRLWLWLLAAGLVVWALATAITAVTRDTILVPTVIMVGSFLVPVTMVAFALSRRHEHRLTPNTEAWIGEPTGGTLLVFQIVYTGLLVVNSLIGAIWVVRRWRRSDQRAKASAAVT